MSIFFLQLSDEEVSSIKKDILQKAIDGLNEEGIPFVGELKREVCIVNSYHRAKIFRKKSSQSEHNCKQR